MTDNREERMTNLAETERHPAAHAEVAATDSNGVAAAPLIESTPETVPAASQGAGSPTANGGEEPSSWHVEAGRKGAQRIHQLIRQGKLYEEEHGLKSGRQRLRQLIEQGKLYEKEHGLKTGSARSSRVPRVRSDQALLTFVHALLRLVKPSVRARIGRMIQALENEGAAQAESLN